MCVCVYENIYGCMGGWAIVPTCKPMGVLRLCMRGACMPVHVRGGGCVWMCMRVFMVVRVIGRLYPYASLWACCVFAWGCTYVGVGEGVHVWGVHVGGCVCVCMHLF